MCDAESVSFFVRILTRGFSRRRGVLPKIEDAMFLWKFLSNLTGPRRFPLLLPPPRFFLFLLFKVALGTNYA